VLFSSENSFVLTPHSKENAIAELVKKFPASHGTWKIYYHIHKSLPLIPFLSQMNILITLLPWGGGIEVQGGAATCTTLGF